MNEPTIKGLSYFVLIAEQKKKKSFLGLLSEYDAHGIEIVYAHGSMNPSALAAAFGLEAEQKKVMITCLLRSERAAALIDVLYREYKFDKPNTGIAFTVPVEGLAF